MKQCLECNTEFEPKSELAVFCSSKCRQKNYRKNMAEFLKTARNDRNNPFLNAARGRDKSGINEDEIKATKKTLVVHDAVKLIPTSAKPEKQKGENAIDYAFRVNEWKKSLK